MNMLLTGIRQFLLEDMHNIITVQYADCNPYCFYVMSKCSGHLMIVHLKTKTYKTVSLYNITLNNCSLTLFTFHLLNCIYTEVTEYY